MTIKLKQNQIQAKKIDTTLLWSSELEISRHTQHQY
jgi:hypothetical protein